MKNLLSVLFLTLTIGLWAQAPQSINYQAVARDASGQIMDAQSGMVRVSILDAVGGNIMYQEEHAVTTNQFGLFTIAIGKGTALQGSFSAINWGAGDRYLNIEADFGSSYEDMGTTQLLSVPFALYAEKSGDGPAGKNSLMDIVTASQTTCPNGGYVVNVGTDANSNGSLDASEIANSFSVCNGADGSATNLTAGQGISITANTISNTGDLDSTDDIITNAYLNGYDLYIVEGTTNWVVNLSGLFTGLDTSNTNEIQTLSVSGNTINLSNGGGNVNISSTPPGAAGEVLTWNGSTWVSQAVTGDNWGSQVVQTSGTNISGDGTSTNPLTVTEADGDPSNELQTLSGSPGVGNYSVTLSNGGGTVTIPTNDADSDPTNELELPASATSGDVLTYNGTSWVNQPLPPSPTTYWTANGNDISNTNSGNVAVGPTQAAPGSLTSSGKALTISTANNYVTTNPAVLELIGTSATGADIMGRIAFGANGSSSPTLMGSIEMNKLQQMLFFTNGNEQMRIMSNGKVGIGTVSPFSTLDVNGQITMRTGAASGYIPVSNANGTMTWTDPTSIALGNQWIPSGTDIYNGNAGNVQIGTNLELTTDASSITFAQGASTNAPEIYMFSGGTSNPARMILAHSPGFPKWGLEYRDGSDIFVFTNATNDVMAIDLQNQRVGIGISNPLNPLDVYHITSNPNNSAMHITYTYSGSTSGINSGLYIQSTNSSTNNTWGIYSATSGTVTSGNSDIAVAGYSSSGGPGDHIGVEGSASSSSGNNFGGFFSAVSSTSGTNYGVYANAVGAATNWAGYFSQGNVYIADNVGIGTTSPTHKLHVVNSTLSRSGYFENNYTSGTTYGIYAGVFGVGTTSKRGGSFEAMGSSTNTNTAVRGWAQDGASSNYGGQFYAFSSASTNYGVYGYATGATNNYSVYASGDLAYTGSLLNLSDKKIKTNISDFNGALNLINQIPIKTFYFDTEKYKSLNLAEGMQYGFIAQDLEKVIPELVQNTTHELFDEKGEVIEQIDLKMVKTQQLIPVLIKAVQEQQQMIEELKKEIELLKQD